MQELPVDAWEQFLVERNEPELLAVLVQLPIVGPPSMEFPAMHRICDVELLGQTYRVCRFVDLIDGRERLFLEPTAFADLEEEGVPYRLRGAALCRWITDESESPSKDAINWEDYLGE